MSSKPHFPDCRTGTLQKGFMSKPDGHIRPDILGRDYNTEAAYALLSAKYEALVKENEKLKANIEMLKEMCSI